ncbi:MAG: serine hydrolase domain-containing protein [Prolixibacteraceae bacterium]
MRQLKLRHLFILSILLLYSPFVADKVNGLEVFSSKEFNKPVNQRISNDKSEFEYTAYIDKQVERFMRRSDLKGVSLAIIEDEKLVFNRAYGFADKELGIETSPEHLFRLASVSKLITAIAIMHLVEEGKLSLDDQVFGSEGLFNEPEYQNIRDRKLLDIKVVHLLNHTAGWTQRYGDPMFSPLTIAKIVGVNPPARVDTYIKFAISRRLYSKPGTMYSYSNMAYVFLGAIIEKITGMSYENFVQFHLLYPNGIYDMHLARNFFEDKYPNEVKYYEVDGDDQVLSSNGDSVYVHKTYGGNDVELLGAAGGWIASASELAKLMTLIDGFNAVPDILSEESIQKMTQEHNSALGWRDSHGGYWIRTGSFAGTANMILRRPDGVEWVFLSNTSNWQGPKFSREINQLMNKITNRVDSWPDMDLFYYYDSESLADIQPLDN